MDIRAFDSYSNTPHEGTNNAIKNCSQPLKVRSTIDNATEIRCEQAERKNRERERLLGQHMNRNQTWSKLVCRNDVTRLCTSVITTEHIEAHKYSCHHHFHPKLLHFSLAIRRTMESRRAGQDVEMARALDFNFEGGQNTFGNRVRSSKEWFGVVDLVDLPMICSARSLSWSSISSTSDSILAVSTPSLSSSSAAICPGSYA